MLSWVWLARPSCSGAFMASPVAQGADVVKLRGAHGHVSEGFWAAHGAVYASVGAKEPQTAEARHVES